MASSSKSEGKDGKKLKPTLDMFQKRFSCGVDELMVWRNCLLYRYSAISHSDICLEYTDYDQQDSVFVPQSAIMPYPPPSSLAKTVFRIISNSSKCITLTLYFSAQSHGTFLCQGTDCPKWDTDECEVLKQFISRFLLDKDITSLTNSLLKTPISFISSVSGSVSLTTPPLDLHHMSVTSVSPDKDSSPAPPSHLLLTADVDRLTHDVILLHPTPPAGSDSNSKPQPHSKKKGTPVGKRTRLQCRRSLHKAFSNPTAVLVNRVAALEKTLDSLPVTELSTENFNTVIEDVKTATKNELRVNICDKYNLICDKLDDLKSVVDKLEILVTQTSKDTNSVKNQLNLVHSHVKKTKMHQKECVTTSTQTDSFQTLKTDGNQSSVGTQTDTSLSNQTDFSLHRPAVPQTFNGAFNGNVAKQAVISIDTPPTPGASKDSDCITKHVSISTDTPPPPVDNKIGDDDKKSTSVSKTTPLIDSKDKDIEQCTIPTSNYYSVLSDPIFRESNNMQNPTTNAGENGLSHRPRSAPESSPSDVLCRMTIPEKTTVLLVGDSVTRFINPKRLVPKYERPFKICVPGISLHDLRSWLSSLPTSRFITDAVFHVGVNSCPSGVISVSEWSHIIDICCSKFPYARISFSSILPAKGKHSFNNSILPSNRNLKESCHKYGIIFIDNFQTFAEDVNLYRDAIHPNPRGTAKLAENLKTLWRSDQSAPNVPPYHNNRVSRAGAINHNSRQPSARFYTSLPASPRVKQTPVQSDHHPFHGQLPADSVPSLLSLDQFPTLQRKPSSQGVPPVPAPTGHVRYVPANHTQTEHPVSGDFHIYRNQRNRSSEVNDHNIPNQFHPYSEQLLALASHLLMSQLPAYATS